MEREKREERGMEDGMRRNTRRKKKVRRTRIQMDTQKERDTANEIKQV